jgi:hypothetical protein
VGRAGIEPATLGLKVDATGFACSRVSSQDGTVEPDRLTCHRVLSRHPVDPALTRSVFHSGNALRVILCSRRPLWTWNRTEPPDRSWVVATCHPQPVLPRRFRRL